MFTSFMDTITSKQCWFLAKESLSQIFISRILISEIVYENWRVLAIIGEINTTLGPFCTLRSALRKLLLKLLLLLLLLLCKSCKSLQSFDVLLGLLCHVSATSRSSETQHFPQYVSCSKDGRQLCTSNDVRYF